MKLIALMLTRNEEHVLPYTLPPLVKICDHIIIADQNSTDDTRAIIKKFPKTILIDNNEPPPPKGRFDSARPLLLETARNFAGNNLLLAIDADEVTPPLLFAGFKEKVARRYKAGCRIRMRSIQLWGKEGYYRAAPVMPRYFGIWGNVVLYDDRKTFYRTRKEVHNERLPRTSSKHYHHETLLVHLHWLFWQKALWQQVWYQMSEFMLAKFDGSAVQKIDNYYYDSAFTAQSVALSRLPHQWQEGYHLPPLERRDHWRKDAVLAMIKSYGIDTFEPLNIWYIDELTALFKQQMGREPSPQAMVYRTRDYWRFYKHRMVLTMRHWRHGHP